MWKILCVGGVLEKIHDVMSFLLFLIQSSINIMYSISLHSEYYANGKTWIEDEEVENFVSVCMEALNKYRENTESMKTMVTWNYYMKAFNYRIIFWKDKLTIWCSKIDCHREINLSTAKEYKVTGCMKTFVLDNS